MAVDLDAAARVGREADALEAEALRERAAAFFCAFAFAVVCC